MADRCISPQKRRCQCQVYRRLSVMMLLSLSHQQVSTYQEDNDAAMEELLNFILLASGAPATKGPYRPPEVCVGCV